MLRKLLTAVMVLLAAPQAYPWGSTAHKFINRNAVVHLPPFMVQLSSQQIYLTDHASDADYRKDTDPSEGAKHFLDLESYPDFAHLPADLSLLTAQYGWTTVSNNGILPWAIVWSVDSLREQFRRGDFTAAFQTAADIGHYVGDAHQPLHCTVNYDGAQTGNKGIHSRYETGMINAFQSDLTVTADSVHYVSDLFSEALNEVLHSHLYVDSILQADTYAKTVSGWSGPTAGQPPASYYAALWTKTGTFTKDLLQEATVTTASLWYTAWVDAGLAGTTDVRIASREEPAAIQLGQNFPNPFNPSTSIEYTIAGVRGQESGDSDVRMVIYDLLGREVATLVDARQAPGAYTVRFDGSQLGSGVYFCRLTAGRFADTKAMVLAK